MPSKKEKKPKPLPKNQNFSLSVPLKKIWAIVTTKSNTINNK